MVGVPGERSNMAPPTLCIVALVLFQAGVAEVIRPAMERRLVRPGWARFNELINRFSMPLFLFHTTGMALQPSRHLRDRGRRERGPPSRPPGGGCPAPSPFILPLVFTLPVIYLFGRKWSRAATPRGARDALHESRAQL